MNAFRLIAPVVVGLLSVAACRPDARVAEPVETPSIVDLDGIAVPLSPLVVEISDVSTRDLTQVSGPSATHLRVAHGRLSLVPPQDLGGAEGEMQFRIPAVGGRLYRLAYANLVPAPALVMQGREPGPIAVMTRGLNSDRVRQPGADLGFTLQGLTAEIAEVQLLEGDDAVDVTSLFEQTAGGLHLKASRRAAFDQLQRQGNAQLQVLTTEGEQIQLNWFHGRVRLQGHLVADEGRQVPPPPRARVVARGSDTAFNKVVTPALDGSFDFGVVPLDFYEISLLNPDGEHRGFFVLEVPPTAATASVALAIYTEAELAAARASPSKDSICYSSEARFSEFASIAREPSKRL